MMANDMQGLKDKPCCGQLAEIPLEKLLEVKKELSEIHQVENRL
jgi:hypothetical protein